MSSSALLTAPVKAVEPPDERARGPKRLFTRVRSRRTAVAFGLSVVLGLAGGGLLWGSTFTTNNVRDQLVAQEIVFPPKGPGLDPQKYPGLQRYAGQRVDNGPKAKAYANQFIATHLKGIAGGRSYAEVSAASRANLSDEKLARQRQSLFEGETLRALLLSAWGWWVVGQITGAAAYAAFAGAGLALVALVYGLVRPPRKVRATIGHRFNS